MKFSYNWLKEYIPKLPKPEKLADLLGRHAFEVNDVRKYKGDVILDIDILPNRMPDASGHIGLAQEISAILGFRSFQGHPLEESKGIPWTWKGSKISKLQESDLTVEILEKDAVLRYHGVLVENITIKPSPKWLCVRLASLGINSINNVVDITNYVMLEQGQPLHAFDYEKIKGRNLIIRKAHNGEVLRTLDGVDNELNGDTLIISDEDRIIDLAGIMGGANSAVDEKTKTIFLQAAAFDPTLIHRASRMLNKRTEASLRYSAGLDPNLTHSALRQALGHIEKIAGGRPKGMIDIYPNPMSPRPILFRPEKANRVLGGDIPQNTMIDIFRRLSFDVIPSKKEKGAFMVTAPTVRRDLVLEEDLIEEVGRIYGYDAIEAKQPVGELIPAVFDRRLFFKEKIRDFFKGAGFDEVRSYSFIGSEEIMRLGARERAHLIEIANPQSRESSHLRPLLTPSLLKAVCQASKFSKTIRYFEIGRIYHWPGVYRDTTELERPKLAFAVLEKKTSQGSQIFFELKGVMDVIFESLGLHDVWYDDASSSPKILNQGVGRFLHPYRFSEMKLGKKNLGILGALHPDLKAHLDIKGEAAVGELFLDDLIDEVEKEKEYRPISKYPAVIRDLAILVPWNIRVVEVLDVVEGAGGKLLIDVDLFDVYEGSEVGAEKKNFAFHLIFQSPDRTLTDKEVDILMQKVIKELDRHPSWDVRK